MGKEHYIEQLKEQLHEIMERPVTLGRAEEITVYADAICALRRMDGHDEAEGFTEDDAKAWTARPARTGRWARRTPWPISQVSE